MDYLWAYLIHVTTTTNVGCVNNLAKRKIFQLEHTIENFIHRFVARQLLSQIYALLGVKFLDIKLRLWKKTNIRYVSERRNFKDGNKN